MCQRMYFQKISPASFENVTVQCENTLFRIHCLFSMMEDNASEYGFEGQFNLDLVASKFKFQNRSLDKNGMPLTNWNAAP